MSGFRPSVRNFSGDPNPLLPGQPFESPDRIELARVEADEAVVVVGTPIGKVLVGVQSMKLCRWKLCQIPRDLDPPRVVQTFAAHDARHGFWRLEEGCKRNRH